MATTLFTLSGRSALVTGASRNIGYAIAVAFAEAGADLHLVARSESRIREVAARIGAATGQLVTWTAGDVGSTTDVARIIQDVTDQHGGVDVLVNNAHATGSAFGTAMCDLNDDPYEEAMAINFFGPLRLSRALAPIMRQRGQGSIINMLSGSGFLPTRQDAPYGCSKAALWMLTRYLASELAPEIRANGLLPGVIKRDEDDQLRPSSQLVMPLVPFGRHGTPQEIVGAALYFASDASSYTTGAVLACNGGRPW